MVVPQLLSVRMLQDDQPSPGSQNTGIIQPCIPVICVIDEDKNDFVECGNSNSENPNFLHPESAEIRPGASSRLSAGSSTLSFFSVASSRISSKVDLDAGRALCHRSTGLLLAFLSGVLMTVYSSMIKFLVEMDSMQVVIIRGVIQAVCLGAVAYYKKMSFIGSREKCAPLILFFVSITGGLRLLFIFTSFSRLPLGDSTTIIFSSPVFVMLLSICILKENNL